MKLAELGITEPTSFLELDEDYCEEIVETSIADVARGSGVGYSALLKEFHQLFPNHQSKTVDEETGFERIALARYQEMTLEQVAFRMPAPRKKTSRSGKARRGIWVDGVIYWPDGKTEGWKQEGIKNGKREGIWIGPSDGLSDLFDEAEEVEG